MGIQIDLKGKVALVTGSTKGIGRGIIDGLAIAGAEVVVVSRSQDDCNRVAEEIREIGGSAMAVAVDLNNFAEIETLVDKVIQHYGQIDILVNNAGSSLTKKAEEITEADWDRILNLDLKSVFFCAQAVGRKMIDRKKGKIINVASILGLVGSQQVLPYCVAKGGVIQMTKALSLEWAKYNIQVNALCPGYVLTPMNETDLKEEKVVSSIIRKIPMRRLGSVDDMVGAVVFMASEASNYMSGQSLVVDGGWTAE